MSEHVQLHEFLAQLEKHNITTKNEPTSDVQPENNTPENGQLHEFLARLQKHKILAKNGQACHFLKIPRELRQKILYYASDHKSPKQCSAWFAYRCLLQNEVIGLSKVHPRFAEDMKFVGNQWRKDSNIFWDEHVEVVRKLGRDAADFNRKVDIFKDLHEGQDKYEEPYAELKKMDKALTPQLMAIIGDIRDVHTYMRGNKEQGFCVGWSEGSASCHLDMLVHMNTSMLATTRDLEAGMTRIDDELAHVGRELPICMSWLGVDSQMGDLEEFIRILYVDMVMAWT